MAVVTPPAPAVAAPQQLVVLDDEAVTLKSGNSTAHKQMLAVCQKALAGWEHVTAADVEFSTVSAGITNVNAKLAPRPELGLAPVMFKVFGEKTEQIIDRSAERVIVVALGEQGFGPQVLALFANGRIEQWLNCCSITPQDMCSARMVPRIARQLRRFHGIQVDLPRQPHGPWGVINEWMDKAQQLQFTDPVKQAAYEQIDFAALAAEVRETQAVCALTQSPVVFGHCDLLSGNILILQQPGFDPSAPDLDGPLIFIDYEYGGYTFRGFDVGNHFTEYAGFEGDYTRYPSKQQQELFFRHYLAQEQQEVAAATAAAAGATLDPPAAAAAAELPPVDPEVLDRLSAEANVWALAAHIYWGVWAIIQACNSPIDFDYMQFSRVRLGEFRRRKEEFLAEARGVFGGADGDAAAAAAADS
ncbi:hypothetical protein OEZ85_002023 [Tetradesmus obliquus]|uniref:ethanolamine kinase n=1 Tax=Tetradesmus obliquus TaxID=3088 RepID=A0ABY8U1V9_TETOB|nr:hypothetical protein OEZ85_002023 [Tetradesmus obliquus]